MADLLAHELRTPIGVVTSAAKLLVQHIDDFDDEARDRMLDVISRNAETAAVLLDRLGRLRDVSLDDVQLQVDRLDVLALVRETVQDLSDSLLVEHPWSVEATGGVQACADAVAVREVLVNLLRNAATHSPDGGPIELIVAIDGPDAIVTVRDHGPGIAPEVRARVFEPFVQLDTSRAGVGLGLYISRGLVTAHGGDIAVADVPGGGTEFRVRLPRRGPGSNGASE